MLPHSINGDPQTCQQDHQQSGSMYEISRNASKNGVTSSSKAASKRWNIRDNSKRWNIRDNSKRWNIRDNSKRWTPATSVVTTTIPGSSWAQSRQSAKRFSSRWNWDSPTPLAAGECAPPPFGTGGRAHSLAAKGVGESKFQRGDIHCGALYI